MFLASVFFCCVRRCCACDCASSCWSATLERASKYVPTSYFNFSKPARAFSSLQSPSPSLCLTTFLSSCLRLGSLYVFCRTTHEIAAKTPTVRFCHFFLPTVSVPSPNQGIVFRSSAKTALGIFLTPSRILFLSLSHPPSRSLTHPPTHSHRAQCRPQCSTGARCTHASCGAAVLLLRCRVPGGGVLRPSSVRVASLRYVASAPTFSCLCLRRTSCS